VYSYRQHGKPMAEPAQMTFALRDEASGWKIAAWAFAGSIVRHASAQR
jgi:hypothetical protein